VKVGAGNCKTYFDFAPPLILLEGDPAGVELTADGQPLTATDDPGAFRLPPTVGDGEVRVEATRDNLVLARERIRLLAPVYDGNPARIDVRFGCEGDPLPDGAVGGRSGAWVEGDRLPPFDFTRLVAESDNQRVWLLGAEPGQIVCRPDEPPPDWQPVWLVRLGKRPTATLCGEGEVAPRPAAGADPAAVKRWRALIHHHRRTLTPERDGRARVLWKEYLREAARG
jgi:hypothetical protein